MSAREQRIAERCHSYEDFRRAARRVLPRLVFDYVDAFERTLLLPHALRPVSERDQSVAPFWPALEQPLRYRAHGPDRHGPAARRPHPRPLRAGGRDSFLPVHRLDQQHRRGLTRDGGVSTLVLTVDVVVNSERRRDARNGMALPLRLPPRQVLSVAAHPRWLWRQVWHGFPKAAHFAGLAIRY